ncbi:DMT family transporter [Solirubrobacter sp. CPCC 204708]|uniref:DMT family transporter n=1 Tax=Solirubrobacter deserti TaxID=2282478 RepID=A0ABT4RK93_9ACTN|nr:DMT family transporter [Solirubrobacter deserti]MBE2319819.1 DMT family transporter [Solirubrobacter deserti]MDA0138700.1 DMT family transporter [Solirubrobacter deserti]
MSVAFALAAALLFALGSALQRRVAVEGSSWLALVRRPPWLAGIAADIAGYAAQAAALAAGRLAVVQPLLVATLVFALPLEGRRLQRVEVAAALAVGAGLALFVTVADPAGGQADAGPAAWAATFAACAAVCALCRRGPVALGCATGVLFGLSAALTKVVVGRLDEGVIAALIDWHVLALILVGAVALDRSQASLRAGSLGTALAAQMALDALTSLIIGVVAFGERLHTRPLALAVTLAGLLLALAGLTALARHAAE